MIEPLTIELKTLTPLWTGGVETGKMDRIHEAGILGSLRWWYEAIVRGLGGEVCIPTSEGTTADRCPRRDDSYCDVCQLFGATGHARRFRLRLEDGKPLFVGDETQIPLPSGRVHSFQRQGQTQYRAGGWYLQGQAQTGDSLELHLTPLGASSVDLLLVPLALISRHASLGAKVSNGYGVVSLTRTGNPITVDTALLDRLPSGGRASGGLPDLRDFFFLRLLFQPPQNNRQWWRDVKGVHDAWVGRVRNGEQTANVYRRTGAHNEARDNLQAIIQNGMLPLAPAVRHWLRYDWNSGLTDQQKNYLFGTTATVCPRCCASPGRSGFRADRYAADNYWCPNCRSTFPKGEELERIASKVNITHAYYAPNGQWEFRIWGCLPCQLPERLNLIRDNFLTNLRTVLTTRSEWVKVFGSSSGIVPPLIESHMLDCTQRDGRAYLAQLLGLNGGGA